MAFDRARSGMTLIALLTLAPAVGAQGVAPPPAPDSAAHAAMLARAESTATAGLPFAWFARGIAAGALAGPIGTIWITRRAQRSDVDVGPANADTTAAYRAVLVPRVQAERREYAFVGGVIGTAVLIAAILKASGHLGGNAASGGSTGGGNPALTRIPAPARSSHDISLSTTR